MSVPKAPLSLPKAPVEPIAAVGTTPAVAKVETEITGITGTFTSTSQAAKGTEIGQKANASSSAALPRLVPPPPPRSQLKPPVVEIMSTSGFCSKHRFQMFEYFIWSESYVTSYMTFFFHFMTLYFDIQGSHASDGEDLMSAVSSVTWDTSRDMSRLTLRWLQSIKFIQVKWYST